MSVWNKLKLKENRWNTGKRDRTCVRNDSNKKSYANRNCSVNGFKNIANTWKLLKIERILLAVVYRFKDSSASSITKCMTTLFLDIFFVALFVILCKPQYSFYIQHKCIIYLHCSHCLFCVRVFMPNCGQLFSSLKF